MGPQGVLISYDHPGQKDSIRGSGILFSQGYILTHGTVFVPLIHVPAQKRWLHNFLKTLTPQIERNDHLKNNIRFRAYHDAEVQPGPVGGAGDVMVVGAWKCPLVSRSLATLFKDWTVGDVARGKDSQYETSADIDLSKDLMAVFILLKWSAEDTGPDPKPDFSDLVNCLTEPFRGEQVVVESTPFGSELFINSLSRGIVSNLVGDQQCLLLTDARTVSGCEGGPIFSTDCAESSDLRTCGKLVGLVSCSLTWWRGEWVGLTIGISLMPVLRRLVRSPFQSFCTPQPNLDNALSSYTAQNTIDDTVVLVRCGLSWGSGVVVDSRLGIIVTCSHVIRNAEAERVSVFYKGTMYAVDVVYRTKDGFAYDMAVLKSKRKSVFTKHMEFIEDMPQKGEAVLAAGFPLLSEREDSSLRPTLVHGCVARTCPFMVQTTCCVQSGASGGPLVRDDKLLGLIVCNAKDSHTGALFPHVNFAIPSSAFRQPLMKYIETGEKLHLHSLESVDPKVQRMWKLEPQVSKL